MATTRNETLTLAIIIGLFIAVMLLLAPVARAETGEGVEPSAAVEPPAQAEVPARVAARVDTARRPRVYFSASAFGAVIDEDNGNRLTSTEDDDLAGSGLILRVGGVIKEHHLVGAMFQGYWRSTRNVLDAEGSDREWGSVSQWTLAPEYRYITRFGLYFGGAAGLTLTLADDRVDGDEAEPDCSSFECARDYLETSDDHAAVGVTVQGTVGYEHRFTKWFAASIEAFAGWTHALDENEKTMNTATYGLAAGIGF